MIPLANGLPSVRYMIMLQIDVKFGDGWNGPTPVCWLLSDSQSMSKRAFTHCSLVPLFAVVHTIRSDLLALFHRRISAVAIS